MSKKKRGFEIDLPDIGEVPAAKPPKESERKRGPMASAIAENAGALNARAAAEKDIRDENDALAHEYVKLKQAGLIQRMVPVDDIVTEALVRDRKQDTVDPEIEELVASIRDVGLSNPIRVEERSDGKYELVQGYRRWTAYKALREAEGAKWSAIPAGVLPHGDGQEGRYRRMVDENLIRKDLSFAEMAMTARNYARDPSTAVTKVDDAVSELFKSTGYQKRTYIRVFARLLNLFEGDILFPETISRNLGLAFMKRVEADEAAVAQVRAGLAALGPKRSAADERDFMRSVISGGDAGAGADAPAEGKGGQRETPTRKPRTMFEFGKGSDRVRCIAGVGQLTLKLDHDLSKVDRAKLERGINELLAALR